MMGVSYAISDDLKFSQNHIIPPFFPYFFFHLEGKFCPTCGKQIFHEKFKVSAKVLEDRWAHKQAKQRELEEVVDFLD